MQQSRHPIVAQAVGICHIVAKVLKRTRFWIEAIEAAAEGSDPELAGRLLGKGQDIVITQSIGARRCALDV